MHDINLHNIFRHLTGDKYFLSTVEHINHNNFLPKDKPTNPVSKFDIIANMSIEFETLNNKEIQEYKDFPLFVRKFLPKGYKRMGIKKTIDKNVETINISFLNSLNMLIRPDLRDATNEECIQDLYTLEHMISRMIKQNYQIDKIRNSEEIKEINATLVANMLKGRISHELIQYVANIFEINLIVFDYVTEDITFYWVTRTKYPYVNFFRDILCMSYIQGNYEPLIPPSEDLTDKQKEKIYTNILMKRAEIKTHIPINIGIPTILHLGSWDLDPELFCSIIQEYFKPVDCDEKAKSEINRLLKMEKSKKDQ